MRIFFPIAIHFSVLLYPGHNVFHLIGLSSVYDAVKMQHLLLHIGQRKRRFKFFRLNTACKWLEIADVEEVVWPAIPVAFGI